VPKMLQAALLSHGISADRISVIVDEQDAIESALRMAEQGDLVLIFADALARGWKQITQFKSDATQQSLTSAKKQAPQTIRPDVEELADDVLPPPPQKEKQPEAAREKHLPIAAPSLSSAPAVTSQRTSPTSEIAGSTDLVRDDRGVYLAREAND
jgi:hypothetical protein